MEDCDTGFNCPTDKGKSSYLINLPPKLLIANRSILSNHNCKFSLLNSFILFFKVDGNWGHWEHWSTCSVTCGGGNRQRFRACDSPSPANGGEPCSGERHQTDNHCNSFHCPVGPSK